MIIREIIARNISIPLKHPVRNPAFVTTHSIYTIVTVRTDEGIEGWSFAYAMPHTRAIVEDLAKILIGETIDTTRLWHKMTATKTVRYDRGGIAMRAVSLIDIALWDIAGKAAQLPIYRMMGAFRDKAPVYYGGGHYPGEYSTKKELFAWLEDDFGHALDKGFSAFKMKIGRETPAVDLERIAFCRGMLKPEDRLMIDCFNAYDANTIIALARKFEQYDIAFLEDPVALDDIPNCAYVAARVTMPVALGECNFTLASFREIIALQAARILQPDLTYIGGFTAYRQFAGIAAFFGLRLAPHWCHDLTVQLALAIPEVIDIEYSDADSPVFLIQLVIQNPVIAEKGFICAPEGSGHGLILDEKAVQKYQV